MASSAGSEDGGLRDSDKERIEDGLADELKRAGVDADLVDQFVALLGQCNVLTRGALRGFADDCPALITHMFEGQPLATLKANGLMATVRVRKLH
jgi:hypothetical protein